MTGKSPLMASEAQRAALMVLAGSRDRGEADRARAVLLTLAGWTSARIAEAFGVREDTVRLWRSDFMSGGVETLKATVAPGPAPGRARRLCVWRCPCWGNLSLTGATRTIPRLRAEIETREGVRISRSQLSKALRKKSSRWRRPRHTLKERQVAAEVERVGLRLHLRQQQAGAGDMVLLYGDESEALTHPYLARVWAKAGADLRVPAPGQAKKVAMLGSFDPVTRRLIVHTSPTKRSSDFVAHLEQLDQRSWSQARSVCQAGGARSGQWSHPHQQTLARSACLPCSLAHRRVAAQICTGAKRHRSRLARPQGASSRASDLRRRRCTQYRNPSGR